MTREEQIREAAKKTTSLFSYRNGYSTAEDAFVAGAKWADNNPPSPWISVEDRLPEMRSDDNPFSERVYVRYVQTVNGKKSIFYEFDELQYVCLSSGKIIGHEWCRHQNKYCRVTHWMPIPKLPKSGTL